MKGKQWLAMGMAVLLLGSGWPAAPARAESESELRDKLSALERQEQELKDKAAASKKDLQNRQQHLEDLRAQIDNIVRQVRLLDGELEALEADIGEKDRQIEAKEEAAAGLESDIAQRRRKLGTKLQRISQTGSFSSLQMLLNADSYVDYLVKNQCIRQITEKDQADMDALEADIHALEQERKALEASRLAVAKRKEEAEALRGQTDGKKRSMEAVYAQVRDTVSEMEKDQKVLEKNLKENQRMQEEMDKKIAALNKKPSEAGDYKGGTMFWPVPTIHTLSDWFGRLRNGKPHKGIDIANHPTIPVYGQKIVAAADGKVLTAFTANTTGGGYGYHVIIDHGTDAKGQRITTLYAHMSEVFVKSGQTVKGGETVLGKAGDTGRVSGPHLHFEVRVNNVCVDPIGKGYVKP